MRPCTKFHATDVVTKSLPLSHWLTPDNSLSNWLKPGTCIFSGQHPASLQHQKHHRIVGHSSNHQLDALHAEWTATTGLNFRNTYVCVCVTWVPNVLLPRAGTSTSVASVANSSAEAVCVRDTRLATSAPYARKNFCWTAILATIWLLYMVCKNMFVRSATKVLVERIILQRIRRYAVLAHKWAEVWGVLDLDVAGCWSYQIHQLFRKVFNWKAVPPFGEN